MAIQGHEYRMKCHTQPAPAPCPPSSLSQRQCHVCFAYMLFMAIAEQKCLRRGLLVLSPKEQRKMFQVVPKIGA